MSVLGIHEIVLLVHGQAANQILHVSLHDLTSLWQGNISKPW